MYHRQDMPHACALYPLYLCFISGNCDESIYDYSGTIGSPNYPNNYPNSVDCSYSIQVPYYTVQFTLTDLITEANYDVLTVSRSFIYMEKQCILLNYVYKRVDDRIGLDTKLTTT